MYVRNADLVGAIRILDVLPDALLGSGAIYQMNRDARHVLR